MTLANQISNARSSHPLLSIVSLGRDRKARPRVEIGSRRQIPEHPEGFQLMADATFATTRYTASNYPAVSNPNSPAVVRLSERPRGKLRSRVRLGE